MNITTLAVELKRRVLVDLFDDRKGERLIYKSVELLHKGGWFNRFRAMYLYRFIKRRYSCMVSPFAKIGKGMYIAHPHGIRIGGTCIIGDNCRLYPGCSLVANVLGDDIRKEGERRHPRVGNDCVIGCNACLLGSITVGHNVIIGAGTVIRSDVPSYAIVVGNPGKIVGFTMTPEEAYANEMKYPESERISLEQLRLIYEKYFVNRVAGNISFMEL